jgi:hypothetical protein
MNFMTLVRLTGFAAVAWTTAALGVGVLGVTHPATSPPASDTNLNDPRPSLVESVAVSSRETPWHASSAVVDRLTGHTLPITPPGEDRWDLVSVSPWRASDGSVEAVARWVNRSDANRGTPFFGLTRFRLPGSTIKSRITLDVLPTGRPCWIAGRHDALLFPAGDGNLYRCLLAADPAPDDGDSAGAESDTGGGACAHAERVNWRSNPPGNSAPMLADPVGLPQVRLHQIIFVALSERREIGKRKVFNVSKIWWLQMNEQASAIVAAGRLTRPEKGSPALEKTAERFPSVAIDSRGSVNLLYLTREGEASGWKLRHAPLEIDGQTNVPRIGSQDGKSFSLAEDLAGGPLAAAADGKSVYACTKSGAVERFAIAPVVR